MANFTPTAYSTGDLITATKLNNTEAGINNLTIAGTANQVLVNGATTAVNNAAITLALPQSIATGSSPTFANVVVSGDGSTTGRGLVVANTAGGATAKSRFVSIATPGGLTEMSANGIYSGSGAVWNHDDATLPYWAWRLDARSGSDFAKLVRGAAGATSTPVDLLSITSAGNATFAGTVTAAGLTLTTANEDFVLISDAVGDGAVKENRIGLKHYTLAEEPQAVIGASTTATAGYVWIGGGFANMNAATEINFYTAANNTTTAGTFRAKIDSAGNFGLGVTPEAWGATYPSVFQFGAVGSLFSAGSAGTYSVHLSSNYYNDGVGDKRIAADYAANYYQYQGTHNWRVAASGAADSAITWTTALTIEADADLVSAGNIYANTTSKVSTEAVALAYALVF